MQNCQGQNDLFFLGSWRKLRESWRYLECPKWLWQTNDWSRGIRDRKWTVYDESSLANEFNDFFTKTLEQLGKDDHPSDSVFDDSKWKKLILLHPGLAPLQVLSYLKLNRRGLLISLVRSWSTRQLDMMVWVRKSSNLSHHHLSIHFAGLLNLSIATNTFPDKWKVGQVTPDCTKVVSNVKEITIAPYQCCQSYLKSSKIM